MSFLKKIVLLSIIPGLLASTIPFRSRFIDWEEETSNSYIVLFKPNVDEKVLDFHSEFIENLSFNKLRKENEAITWFSWNENDNSIIGYSAKMDKAALNTLSRDPSIDIIERDAPVSIFVKKHKKKPKKHQQKVQHDAPWGLARSSHREIPNKKDFIYEETGGEKVDVYVIDTGIYVEHEDFEKRATFGKSFIKDRQTGKDVMTDDNGHGSHCSGSIGGKKFGMCKKCHLIGVKVLDGRGSGSLSGVISGVEWAMKNAKETGRKSVISMSLGGGYSEIMNRAVDAATAQGIYVVVAAGNSRENSCDFSPASAKSVISVGAMDVYDSMADFSNYGSCMHIFAPGVGIDSTWIDGPNSHTQLSGTSMAAPHVAGAVGSLLSRPEFASLSPKELREKLQKMATKDVVRNIPYDLDTVNLLLFNGADERKKKDDDDEKLVEQLKLELLIQGNL